MRNFKLYVLIAFITVIIAAMTLAVVPANAATSGKTIYISDTGNGDGTTESSPLGPESTPRVAYNPDTTLRDDGDPSNDYKYYAVGSYSTGKFYMNSVLYQAAEQLASTGGKIVIVGDVVIDYSKTYAGARTSERDFFMPSHGNNNITISSSGDGKLIVTEGSFINLGGKTTFENINIITRDGRNTGTLVAICCGGYETVFGDNIVCTNSTAGTSAGAWRYLSIAGTERQRANLQGDTNITIKSGTWNCVYGAYGNTGNFFNGNSTINIEGGTIKGDVVGGAKEGVVQFGNINVNISGGTIAGTVYATNKYGMGAAGYKANIKISSGTLSSSTWVKKYYNTLINDAFLPEVTVDLSHYTKTLPNTIEGDNIYYPVSLVSSVSQYTAPTNTICYLNESYYPDGLEIKVNYSNNKTAIIPYTRDDSNFVVTISNNTVTGTATPYCKYGGKHTAYFSDNRVNVIPSPVPSMLGAQISVVDVNAGLRFVAEMAKGAEKFMTVKDYGFVVWDSAVLTLGEGEKISSVHGLDGMSGSLFRPDADPLKLYNNDSKTTFCATYPNIKVNNYAKEYTAAAYVTYEYNGKTYTEYSDTIKRSVYGVAKLAVDTPYEKSEWIKENIIDRYDAYSTDKSDKKLGVYEPTNSETLRDILMNELNNVRNFAWTPSESVTLSTKSVYTAGTTYYGMAYVTNSKSEFDEFKQYVKSYKNGTNVYLGPVKGIDEMFLNSENNGNTNYQDDYNYIQGNKNLIDEKYHSIKTMFPAADYTGMVVNLWNKVGTNNTWPTDLSTFIPSAGRGTVAVGTYDPSFSGSATGTIISNNSQAVMEASYAACKRGDVLIANKSGSSIYMIVEDYDGTSKKLNMVYFGPDLVDVKDSSGNVIGKSHFQQFYYTFENLYKNGFIPVTLPELATGCDTNTAAYVKGFDGELTMKTGVLSGNVLSNKQIISVNVKLSRFNNSGEFYNETIYCNSKADQNTNNFSLIGFDMSDVLPFLVGGKEYTLTVDVDIANEGVKTLVEYKYIKPAVVKDNYAVFINDFDLDYTNMGDKVVKLMKDQMNIYWKSSYNFNYVVEEETPGFTPNTSYSAGKIYRGVIYSNKRSTLADFNSILKNPTTNSTLGKVYTIDKYNGVVDWDDVIGNHCSASMYHSYQTVSRLHANSRTNPNLIMVGVRDIYEGIAGTTDSVSLSYGVEAMYEAYALAKKGDFMYRDGHTRMVQEVYVERNSTTGRIDPDNSYIKMIEQTNMMDSVASKSPNKYGVSDWTSTCGYDSTWWEHKYSFKLLATLTPKCIILRPTEFWTGEAEEHYIALTKKATESSLETNNAYMGRIESNYPIIGIYAEVILSDGTVYKLERQGMMGNGTNIINVATLFASQEDCLKNPGYYLCKDDFRNQSYTYTLTVELAAGKKVIDTLTVN